MAISPAFKVPALIKFAEIPFEVIPVTHFYFPVFSSYLDNNMAPPTIRMALFGEATSFIVTPSFPQRTLC
jgi:hypothetical protein